MKRLFLVLTIFLLLATVTFLVLPAGDLTINPNYPVNGPVVQIYTDATKTTGYAGYTGAQLDLILRGTPLAGMGEDIAYLCYLNDKNEMIVINHMGLESGWGRSAISIIKNNLFGFHAFDRDAFGFAYRYPTRTDSLAEYCAYTRVKYDMPSGPYFVDGTILGMNKHYASDPNWHTKIISMANSAHAVTGAPLWVLGFSQQKYRSFEESWREPTPVWTKTLTVGQVLRDLYKVSLARGGKAYPSAGLWAFAEGVYTSDAYNAPSPRAYTVMLMKRAWMLQHRTTMPVFYTSTTGQDTIGQYWARLFVLYKEAF